jgi:sugar/nucleoside kinase (ribokinase family)
VIAAIGNLSLDVVAGAPQRPGGPVFYAARTLARLGSEACVVASCAAADKALFAPQLEALGLPLAWRDSSTTASYTFHYESERRVMAQLALADPWQPAEALAAAGSAEWVLVGGLARGDFPEEALAALAEGRRLLVDAQGLVRARALGPLRTDGDIGDVLRYVTILKLDEDEAVTLVGRAEPKALRSLGVPEVLLTRGSKGSFVVAGTRIDLIPAPEVVPPVDPTGAGDTFGAAYLDARARGAEPSEAGVAATRTVAAFLA